MTRAGGVSRGEGLTFELNEWRQGSLFCDDEGRMSLWCPYRKRARFSPPMHEVSVEVTEHAPALLKSGEDLLDLVGRAALIAFRQGAPLLGTLLLLPLEAAEAAAPARLAPWLRSDCAAQKKRPERQRTKTGARGPRSERV